MDCSFFVTKFRVFMCGASPRTKTSKRGTTFKTSYFTAIGLSSVKTIADRHRHATYHNKHRWQTFYGYQHRWP